MDRQGAKHGHPPDAAKRVLAVASLGGHWEQLMLLAPAFEGHEVLFATTDPAIVRERVTLAIERLTDCNQNQPIRAALCLVQSLALVARQRPDVVISTGAAPGLFCLLAGRLFGAKTLWIDSVANAEELSLCGKLARHLAHQCLTQWRHLEQQDRVLFKGSVL